MQSLSIDLLREVGLRLEVNDVISFRSSFKYAWKALNSRQFYCMWCINWGILCITSILEDDLISCCWFAVERCIAIFHEHAWYTQLQQTANKQNNLLLLKGDVPGGVDDDSPFYYRKGIFGDPPRQFPYLLPLGQTIGFIFKPENLSFTLVLSAALDLGCWQHNFFNLWIGTWRVVLEALQSGEIRVWCESQSRSCSFKCERNVHHTYLIRYVGGRMTLVIDGVVRCSFYCTVPREDFARVYVGSDRHDAYWGAMDVSLLAMFNTASPRVLSFLSTL